MGCAVGDIRSVCGFILFCAHDLTNREECAHSDICPVKGQPRCVQVL